MGQRGVCIDVVRCVYSDDLNKAFTLSRKDCNVLHIDPC